MDNQVAVRYTNAKGGTHSHMLIMQGSNPDLVVAQATESNDSSGILSKSIKQQTRCGIEEKIRPERLEIA